MSELSTVDDKTQRLLARTEIEQFYAAQMALLDDGDAAGWVGTFAEDGVFVPPSGAGEVRGRQALLAGTEKTVAGLAEAGTVRRHVLTNLNLSVLRGARATVSAYVQIVDSTDGETRMTYSTLMRDELVSDGADWFVRHRTVRRDDLPAPETH